MPSFSSHAMTTVSTVAESILISATLVLLLVVSATIIARSYVIRRRHRALIAEAIANGTYVPPVRVRVGRKPKMYEVHLVKEVEDEVVRVGEKGEGRPSLIEKEKRRAVFWDGLVVEWNKMLPVSCRLLRPPRPPPDTAVPTPPSPASQPTSRFWRWRLPGRGHRQTPSPSPSTTPPPPPTSHPEAPRPSADPRPSSTTMRVLSPDPSEKFPRTPTPTSTPSPPSADEHVRVAVLISMPFAMSMAAKKASEYGHAAPELPYMEFGVCAVPLERPFDSDTHTEPPAAASNLVAGVGAATGTSGPL
ncbi:hypothetical protein VTO73DRAFT_4148 [Trametes versicolor]